MRTALARCTTGAQRSKARSQERIKQAYDAAVSGGSQTRKGTEIERFARSSMSGRRNLGKRSPPAPQRPGNVRQFKRKCRLSWQIGLAQPPTSRPLQIPAIGSRSNSGRSPLKYKVSFNRVFAKRPIRVIGIRCDERWMRYHFRVRRRFGFARRRVSRAGSYESEN